MSSANTLPPTVPEAEAALLGCLIVGGIDNARRYLTEVRDTGLTTADFWDTRNAVLFNAIARLIDEHGGLDLVQLKAVLSESGVLENIGGMDRLVELVEGVSLAENAAHYARIVHETAGKRYLMDAADKLERAAGSGIPSDQLRAMVDSMQLEINRRFIGQASAFKLTRLSDVQPEQVRWLWPGRIARGKLTMLAGDPGLGKSYITLDIAARISNGAAWPDAADKPQEPGSVLLIGGEDGLADTVRPRLDAAGANVSRIVAMNAAELDLSRNLAVLERKIGEIEGCVLVIIDPITAYLGAIDSHKNADVRSVLTPLAAMADRLGVAMVIVSHLNKNTTGNAQYRVSGSVGFMATVRTAWHVVKDKDNSRRRLVLPSKNNLAADLTGLAYELIPSMVEGAAAVQWEANAVNMTADEAMQTEAGDDERTERDHAAEWLRGVLADGPLLAKAIFTDAKIEGISEKTVRRAADRIGVVKQPVGFQKSWQWSLPDTQTCPDLPTVAQPKEVGKCGEAGASVEHHDHPRSANESVASLREVMESDPVLHPYIPVDAGSPAMPAVKSPSAESRVSSFEKQPRKGLANWLRVSFKKCHERFSQGYAKGS